MLLFIDKACKINTQKTIGKAVTIFRYKLQPRPVASLNMKYLFSM